MAIDVEVTFAGLCMLVIDEAQKAIGVLLPDGRAIVGATEDETKGRLVFADQKDAEPHAGFIQMNLANLDQRIPPGDNASGPAYEIVRRFDREELTFLISPEAIAAQPLDTSVRLHIPDFAEFAPTLDIKPDLFSNHPDPVLLSRTLIPCGTIEADAGPKLWEIAQTLNAPGSHPYTDQFIGLAVWRFRIEEEMLGLRFTSMIDGSFEEISLRPLKDFNTIQLKISNLCSDNPLEWRGAFPKRTVLNDVDFKWFYDLLDISKPKLHAMLNSSPSVATMTSAPELPHPFVVKKGPHLEGGPGCDMSRMYRSFRMEPIVLSSEL